MAISRLSRMRTELFEPFVVPSLAPHPVQMDRQFPGHRYLRDLSSSTATRGLGQDRIRSLADIPTHFFVQKPTNESCLTKSTKFELVHVKSDAFATKQLSFPILAFYNRNVTIDGRVSNSLRQAAGLWPPNFHPIQFGGGT
jgi:hypothetical protein